MGSSQSVVLAAQVTSTQRASQPSAEDHVLSSQTLPSSGSADPILVVYIYADKRDSVAHAAALEFAESMRLAYSLSDALELLLRLSVTTIMTESLYLPNCHLRLCSDASLF